MSLTSSELAAVVAELEGLLPGHFLNKLNAPGAGQLQLVFKPGVLWVEWNRGLARLHLVEHKQPAPPRPPAWVMRARAEIGGKRLAAVEQVPADRIVRLRFDGRPQRQLVIELFGRGRLLLLDGADGLLATLVGPTFAGDVYAPPAGGTAPARAPRFGPPDPDRLAVNRAVAEHYASRAAEQALSQARSRWSKRLRTAERRARRRLGRLQADLRRTEEASGLYRAAEALKVQLGAVRRGQTRAELPDPYDPEGRPVVVELDPALDARDNMRRMFARARRLTAARGTVGERLDAARSELEAVRRAAAELAMAGSGQQIEALAPRLEALCPPRPPGPGRRRRRRRRPYRLFRSAAGRSILVGRSGADNHQLTFRVARGHDLWLHAREAAGAHVVLRLDRGDEVDEQSLLDAASLAAVHSPLKNAAKVEIHYTRVKHVHPVKSGPPGLVSLAKARTLLVRLEPDRLDRLRRSAEHDS
jgi:predicted ribosome quality control (RQC) complex YloA/Tae2 family protein